MADNIILNQEYGVSLNYDGTNAYIASNGYDIKFNKHMFGAFQQYPSISLQINLDKTFTQSMFDYVENAEFIFSSCQKITGSPILFKNATTMRYSYYNCNLLTGSPVCGDYVKDFYGCYEGCENITGKAACGDNVTDMGYAYANSGITEPYFGPNVISARYAYANCNYIKNGILPELTGDSVWLYYNCHNLENVYIQTSEAHIGSKYGYSIFQNCNKISNIYFQCSPPDLIAFSELFMRSELKDDQTINLGDIPDSVTNMYEFAGPIGRIGLRNCLLEPKCGSNVVNFANAYYACKKITKAVCGPKVEDMNSAYESCPELLEAACGDNVVEMNRTYMWCPKLTKAACGDKVTSMYMTYKNCTSLTEAVCGPQVETMSETYDSCSSLITAACGDKVTSMWGTYNGCTSLIKAACGPEVTGMSQTYKNCTSLTEAVCGDKVVSMFAAYESCKSLKTAVCGESVIDMTRAFQHCKKLTQGVCGPSVRNMNHAYYNTSIQGDLYMYSDEVNDIGGCFDLRPIVPLNFYVNSGSNTNKLLYTKLVKKWDWHNEYGYGNIDFEYNVYYLDKPMPPEPEKVAKLTEDFSVSYATQVWFGDKDKLGGI